MALQGTHIRFAVDLAGYYQVTDIPNYIAGTVYPDTRYITRTKRELTHPPDFKKWDVQGLTDYKKGWYAHLLCDEIQGQIFKEKFSHLFSYDRIQPGNKDWLTVTALKLLQDLHDVQEFNIASFLPSSLLADNPNNEDKEPIERFYDVIHETYQDISQFTISSYNKSGLEMGLPEKTVLGIEERAYELSEDAELMELIHAVYAEMVYRVKY